MDIFEENTQDKLSNVFKMMCESPSGRPTPHGNTGLQSWSRGPIAPASIVVLGTVASGDARIQARYGEWRGTAFPVGNSFQDAHAAAEKEAREKLEELGLM